MVNLYKCLLKIKDTVFSKNASCTLVTYHFIIPEGIPGVPAVVVVNVGHIVLVVDGH